MERVYSSLTQRAVDVHKKLVGDSGHSRIVIAFSGPLGSGKSTIAEQVVQRINTIFQRPLATCLAMDGFHYTRAYLNTLPNHIEAHTYRGAAWTFDADGVVDLVKTLSASRNATEPITILAPSFDHNLKDPVPDAIRIEPETEVVIIEGNWLLLDRDPWKQITEHVDDTWFVDVDPELALHRIARRHLAAGIEDTWEAAITRAKSNDLRNGNEVRTNLLGANVHVTSVEIDGEE
ncbi:P-loop containing nucleoside triphosphate hydrolase protein [Xylaria arbuscula]|nr:P-loop containing nucleoside triphosphate hydrolase protein [Xylaria arbuscula]